MKLKSRARIRSVVSRRRVRKPARRNYQDTVTVNCPKCDSPLTLCMGVNGPYYFCRCYRR